MQGYILKHYKQLLALCVWIKSLTPFNAQSELFHTKSYPCSHVQLEWQRKPMETYNLLLITLFSDQYTEICRQILNNVLGYFPDLYTHIFALMSRISLFKFQLTRHSKLVTVRWPYAVVLVAEINIPICSKLRLKSQRDQRPKALPTNNYL